MPAAINDSGDVAGTTASHRAAVWSASRGLRELPLPPGLTHSEAVGINTDGQIIGMAYDPTYQIAHAFRVVGDSVTLLPGEGAIVHGIDDNGTIYGETRIGDSPRPSPVRWIGDSLRPIDTCCGGALLGTAEPGVAIGVRYDGEGRFHAFRWSEATGLQILGPSVRFSAGVAGNSRGQVVIDTFPGALLDERGHAMRVSLGTKGPSHTRALSECGVVLGDVGPYSDALRAFAWEASTGFHDLNAYLPEASEWTLESAVGMNRHGAIVGRGDSGRQQDCGFLLLPRDP